LILEDIKEANIETETSVSEDSKAATPFDPNISSSLSHKNYENNEESKNSSVEINDEDRFDENEEKYFIIKYFEYFLYLMIESMEDKKHCSKTSLSNITE